MIKEKVNKKIPFEYFCEEEFTAGLVLKGLEVKAMEDYFNLESSHLFIENNEVFLTWQINTTNCKTKLLLTKAEIKKLIGKVQVEHFTIVPYKLVYQNKRYKLIFWYAKGKKKYDKRETIKTREWNRKKQQLLNK